MGCGKSKAKTAVSNIGPTPSCGNPKSSSALNTELNNVARNTNDTEKARALVAEGASLRSINGEHWRHTPLHQAAYHGRYEMAKTLVELGAPLDLHSNPVGRGATGTPLELARGGGHDRIAKMLEQAMKAKGSGGVLEAAGGGGGGGGRWVVYQNIDMCGQGDVEVVHNWRGASSMAALRRTCEQKNYSAISVGSFGHAALKRFDYQLTRAHCKPTSGYTNEIHIYFRNGQAPRDGIASADAQESAAQRKAGKAAAAGDVPSTISVAGARTHEGHGHWPNDTWHLRGEHNGRPQWYRQGNPADFIKWDGSRWTLNGMQPMCYFQHKGDTPLPPKSGWQSAEMGVSSMPTLSYAGGGGGGGGGSAGKKPAVGGYTPPASGATEEGPMLCLVAKGSPLALRFEHAHALREPGGKPLTLSSHPGFAVVPRYEYPREAAEWQYVELGIGPAPMAMVAQLQDHFLVRLHDERVMDIAHWKYEEGNTLNVLRSGSSHPGNTRWAHGGRSFVVNEDGTISPQRATHLVLGAQLPKLIFVNRESPRVCRFEHATKLGGFPSAAPLTLASHPGLAVVQMFDDARVAYHEWNYIALGVGDAASAVSVRYNAGCLEACSGALGSGGLVTPAHLNLHEGNHMDFVRHLHDAGRVKKESDKKGGARPVDFSFNADGSLSPASAPHLALGLSHEMPPAAGAAGKGVAGAVVPPTVMGVCVEGGAASSSSAVPVARAVEAAVLGAAATADRSARPLFETVELLRRELGIEGGNVHEAVTRAAEMLGVRAEGTPLADLAALCAKQLGV